MARLLGDTRSPNIENVLLIDAVSDLPSKQSIDAQCTAIYNATLIEMFSSVRGSESQTKQLWTEYLRDFRKGKIAEIPSR